MSDEFTCLRFKQHAGDAPGADVLEVVIDRPDSRLNAVNGQLHEELTRLFPRLQSERDARAVLLTGTGAVSRTGHFPVADYNDGVTDEDGDDDLNGNGVIEQIRKYAPGQGTHRRR